MAHIRIFQDGVQSGTTASNASSHTSTGSPLYIGKSDVYDTAIGGQLDEVRIANDEAVYTSNFIPPTAPFP